MLEYWRKGGQCSECQCTKDVGKRDDVSSGEESRETETMGMDGRVEYETQQGMVSLEMGWARCEVGQQNFFDVNGVEVQPRKIASGVPARALPESMWKGWAGPRQGLSHPNQRFLEKLEFCASREDPVTMQHQETDFCPVLWFDTEQRRRAQDVLGKEPPLAEGPAPNYEVETPETMRELFEPHLVEETYERRVRQQQQIRQRIGLVKKEGKRFAGKMKDVEGGKDGVVYGVEARKEQFRHLIFENVNGKPVVVRERLPDAFTDMNLDALLRMAVQCNAPDMGIVSEIALYGMRSETACRPTTASWPLYKGGIENIQFLQANRDKQRSGYMTPRVSKPAPHPRYEPERTHPKGVVIVLKEDGAEKNREVTDYAAQRLSCVENWQRQRVWFIASRMHLEYLDGSVSLRRQAVLG